MVQIIPSRSCRSSRADRADHAGQIVQIKLGKSCRSCRADHLSLDCNIFFLPDAWVVSGTSQPIKNSSSGSPNKSTDTSFALASAPQGLQEAHGLHVLVPGAGVVGGTYQPIKIFNLGVLTNLLIPHLSL